KGDDSVHGGSGDDLYIYQLGDGNDTLNDSGGTDTLRFGAGIYADDVSVTATEKDMVITLADGHTITITNWYVIYVYDPRIERIEFSDGTTWEIADIMRLLTVTGTDGDDVIVNQYLKLGTTYQTGKGDDSVHGGKGDDLYIYELGDGNDTINDSGGTDTLRFGVGIDVDNISVTAVGSDMLITLENGHVITFNYIRIENIEFYDGGGRTAASLLN
ncbi:MAG: hypothetical protein HRU24_15310, partial [Gammaproteobacteria bacterium]|nr:hypothetical protein [Gammaproteobacteria bacterium]